MLEKRPLRLRSLGLALVLAAGSLALPGCVAEADSYTAAGIIAFCRVDGEAYVLLADHVDSGRGWASFGGNRAPGESIARAASREFWEETRCVYPLYPEEEMEGVPWVSRERYLSYVVEVEYVPAQVFESAELPPEHRRPEFNERGPWVWVPLSEIERCVEAGKESGTYTLLPRFVPRGATTRVWDQSATVLAQAVEQRLFEPDP